MDTEMHESIYGPDKIDGPHGWIQHKGTMICIDLHCECGYHGHYDSDYFFYAGLCPQCKRAYAIGEYVRLLPLDTPEKLAYFEDIPEWE